MGVHLLPNGPKVAVLSMVRKRFARPLPILELVNRASITVKHVQLSPLGHRLLNPVVHVLPFKVPLPINVPTMRTGFANPGRSGDASCARAGAIMIETDTRTANAKRLFLIIYPCHLVPHVCGKCHLSF